MSVDAHKFLSTLGMLCSRTLVVVVRRQLKKQVLGMNFGKNQQDVVPSNVASADAIIQLLFDFTVFHILRAALPGYAYNTMVRSRQRR